MPLNKKLKIPTTREMLNSIGHARQQWSGKTPFQKWCYMYGIGKAAMGIIKKPIFREDLRIKHWMAYFYFVLVSMSISMTINAIYYYGSRGELTKGLPSTCMTSLGIANCTLVYIFVTKGRYQLQALIDFGGKYIYPDSHEKTDYNRICSEHMDKTMRSFIIKIIIILIAIEICLSGPLNSYMIHGIKTTALELRVPFTEARSDEEWLVNFILMIALGVHGLNQYLGIEVIMTLFGNIVTLTPKLAKHELQQLADDWKTKSISKIQLNLRFRNVIQQSFDIDTYVQSVSDILYWRTFVNIILFAYMIGLSIFCQFTVGFDAGYGMGLMTYVQLFYICELGEDMKDNGYAEMLYEIKWDNFPMDIQKDILLLMSRKQTSSGLKFGPFGVDINRETFKIISNKIYSFIMFLINIFN